MYIRKPNEEGWNSLCGLEDDEYNSLEFTNVCNNNEIINRLCNDGILIKSKICPDNR